MVQYWGSVLQHQRGDFGVLDGVAAARERNKGIVERLQPQSYPYGHSRRHHLRLSVSEELGRPPETFTGLLSGFDLFRRVWYEVQNMGVP